MPQVRVRQHVCILRFFKLFKSALHEKAIDIDPSQFTQLVLLVDIPL